MRAPSPTPESCRAPDPGGQGHYDGRCGAGGRSGAPPAAWLLCVLYVISILNVVPLKSLHYDTPTRVCLGHTADISHLLQFKFWERVYIFTGDTAFPGSKEIAGYYAGPAPNKGDALCSWVYTEHGQLIARSVLRPATTQDPVIALERPCGETSPLVLQTMTDFTENAKNTPNDIPFFSPSEIIGRTFLLPRGEDGSLHRAEVLRRADSVADDVEEMFVVRIADGKQTDILTYDAIVQGISDQLEREADQSEEDRYWLFKEVKDHRKAGNSWEVLLKWEDDSETWEPLSAVAKDDPIHLAKYAIDKDLLELPGWKRFRRYNRKNQKKLNRLLRQAKLKSTHNSIRIKYGVKVPRTHKEAMTFDEEGKNCIWYDAEQLELRQIYEYKTFADLGKNVSVPFGHTKIRVHLVYDVKQDGRRKARLVADGHLTGPNTDTYYSSVVSLYERRS